MVRNGKIEEAISLVTEALAAADNESEIDIFILECSMIDTLQFTTGSQNTINMILEDMILYRGYTAEAIVHRLPSLSADKACVRKLKELTKKSEKDD